MSQNFLNESVGISRKRARKPETWQKNKDKLSRYSSTSLPVYPVCSHSSKAYQCRALTMADILRFHKTFYRHKSKIQQDNIILKYTSSQNPQRKRPGENPTNVQKSFSAKYYVPQCISGKLMPVCRQTFLDILQIKKDRVTGVIKRHFLSRSSAVETRGGDRYKSKFLRKKQAVVDFIKKFQPVESHYCRTRTTRSYLASDLNIRKMYRMFLKHQSEPELFVKESYFRKIFNTHLNIGFGHPRTDMCSTCISIGEKLKMAKEANVKAKLIIEKRVHKLKAKAFYSLLQEEKDDLITFSFDCQKNLPLPKLPDQSAYYSRQLYIYNFTIVTGTSHSRLTPENVHTYTWTEDEYAKGSNQIASALFHRLTNTNFEGKQVVRLMADGCSGQNKNSTIIGMCAKWLFDAPLNIKRMEIIFPIVGHSFIPPDRVFANIEKKIRRKEVICDPGVYIDIFKKHATVYKLGTGVEVFNWKSAVQEVLKPPGQWHFKFIMAKRFILKRDAISIKVQGENAYRSDVGTLKLICKKGKKIQNISPETVPMGTIINELKLKDVERLLKVHYGSNWKDHDALEYYKRIILTEQAGVNNDNDDINSLCDNSCHDLDEESLII